MYNPTDVFECFFDMKSETDGGMSFEEFSELGAALESGNFAGLMQECAAPPTPEELFQQFDENNSQTLDANEWEGIWNEICSEPCTDSSTAPGTYCQICHTNYSKIDIFECFAMSTATDASMSWDEF